MIVVREPLSIANIDSMDHVVQYAQERHDRLQPLDIPDNLGRFQLQTFENGTHTITSDDMSLNLTDRSFSQMCSRIGVPAEFAARCPAEMRKEMVDYWINKTQKNVLFRTIDDVFYPDTVRAVLSDVYQPLDDITIFPMIRDVLGDLGSEVEIKRSSWDDEYTHVRIVLPKHSMEPRKGDVVQAGVHITNSETGNRAFRINSFVYRLVCTNGLVREEYAEKTVFRHVGDPARMLDNVAAAIQAATQGSVQLMQSLARTVETRFTVAEDGIRRLEAMYENKALNKRQFDNSSHFYTVRGDHSLYGLVNAVTEAAQREDGMEPRYQMEQVASKLLKAA